MINFVWYCYLDYILYLFYNLEIPNKIYSNSTQRALNMQNNKVFLKHFNFYLKTMNNTNLKKYDNIKRKDFTNIKKKEKNNNYKNINK